MIETDSVGDGFLVPKADQWVGKWQREAGRLDHDQFLTPIACSWLRRGNFAIDVGAFNGDWTLPLSNAVGEAGLVLAIEPNNEIFPLLRHNVGRFQYANVICVSEAVGLADGNAEFPERWIDNMAGIYLKGQKEGSIRVSKLSELARRVSRRRVDFIKIDAEGWEPDILKGAQELILEDRPVMILEVNIIAMGRLGTDAGEIFNFLKMAGYKFDKLEKDSPESELLYNILCVPRERFGLTFSEPSPADSCSQSPEQTPAP